MNWGGLIVAATPISSTDDNIILRSFFELAAREGIRTVFCRDPPWFAPVAIILPYSYTNVLQRQTYILREFWDDGSERD